MTIKPVFDKLPWKFSVGSRALGKINYVVVHHDAVLAPAKYDAMARYETEGEYHVSKGWGHLSYHLKIDRAGNVYQTLPFEQIGWHAGNYKVNLTGIGICLDGDFTKQAPTAEQVAALDKLMRYLANERPDMPLVVRKSFFAHKEVRLLPTACPGPAIATQVVSYRKGVTP